MRWPLLATLLAALPLAGCTSDSPEPAGLIPLGGLVDASGLASASYYSFHHPGGNLVFSLAGNGSAALEIFGGDDTRLGQVEFGTNGGSAASYGLAVPAGEPVIHVLSINGTLLVESGGRALTGFQPLVESLELIVLVSRAPGATPVSFPPLTGGDPVDEVVPVPLQRAPSELRVLASGDFADLAVDVYSSIGPVLTAAAQSTSFGGPAFFPGGGFVPLEATLHAENYSDGRFEARVRAADLNGALVLESTTYSRAGVSEPTGAGLARDVPEFTYGPLVADAVVFQVHADARWLYLWQEAGGPPADPDSGQPTSDAAGPSLAWVALYDPDDGKMGTVLVPANVTIAIPVQHGGDYVAVLLSGSATLGSDAVPADFQIHPLAQAETLVPSQAAGADGTYAVSRADVTPAGVPFRVEATTRGMSSGDLPTDFTAPCATGGQARLDVDGESILLAGDQETSDLHGSLRLRTAGLSITWDGFGEDACDHPAVKVIGYIREPLG